MDLRSVRSWSVRTRAQRGRSRVVHRPPGRRGARRRDLGRVERQRLDLPRRAGEGGLMQARTRVLIIDDHKLFSEVITPTLERMGNNVIGAMSTAAQGLEAA